LEKKLVAAERSSQLMTEQTINGLSAKLNENDLGKGAMVFHIAQQGGIATQMLVHRPIGNTPDAVATDWALTPKGLIGNLLGGVENPFEKKTGERVSALKVEHGIAASLLKRNAAGLITYPDGTVRAVALDECRKLFDIHKSVEGGEAMTPAFCYGSIAVYAAETAYLNSLAKSPELQDAIQKETLSYRMHETRDPVTGQSQVTMKWASGIPREQLLTVFMEVISTGQYNAAKWDPIKEYPSKKTDPFAIWGYDKGVIPADKLDILKKALLEYAKLRKEHNVLMPQGQKAKDSETAEQKATRIAKHNEMQKAANAVNKAEKFGFKLPVIVPAPTVQSQAAPTRPR
jgi:hypothetical protein